MDNKIIYGLIAVVVVLSALNLVFVTGISQSASATAVKAKEDSRPADIEVIKLSDPSCVNCFNIEKVLADLKSKNFKVNKEDSVNPFSDQGKEFVKKFGVAKLPTLIVSGEVKKPSIQNYFKAGWEAKESSGKSYAVYKDVLPPYQNPLDPQIIGKVSLKYLTDSSCQDCADLSPLISGLKSIGIIFSEEKTLEYKDGEGQELIKKFGVERIPAIIVSKNILEYPAVKEVWSQVNATEKDGFYALHTQSPPYRDTKSDQIKGLVEMVYLNDSSCKNCYDVKSNRQIVGRLGLALSNVRAVDISSPEGKDIVSKYKIQKAPVLLLSPDAKEYQTFMQIWPDAGSVEPDGWFVMRKPELLGNYRDLTTGNEIVMQKQQPVSGSR